MKVVFAGTPEFAATILGGLLASRHDVLAAYTQPDRPAGRGRQLRESAVKVLAREAGVAVAQPVSLRGDEQARALRDVGADVMIVAAYGLILPRTILAVPPRGCINVHASLLPRWRGAAPIQRALLAGDRETGVSIMQMDAGLDTGAVLAARRCPIMADDDAQTLHDRLAALGRDALLDVLDDVEAGHAHAVPQDDSLATYAARLDKSEGRLDWSHDARDLERRVRSLTPWPGAWTVLPDGGAQPTRLRVLVARADEDAGSPPGTVVEATPATGLRIACARGSLRLLRVQPAGRRAMAAGDFLNARPLAPGQRLP